MAEEQIVRSKTETGFGATKSGEYLRSHLQELAADFQGKAGSVYDELAKDFVAQTAEGEVWLPSSPGKLSKFKTKAVHSLLLSLRRYVEDRGEYADNAKYAADIMTTLSSLVKLFPDRIPEYFVNYKINNELKIIEGKYYWADGTIEIFQDDIEPLILFACEQSKIGSKLPHSFAELKKLYQTSRSGSKE